MLIADPSGVTSQRLKNTLLEPHLAMLGSALRALRAQAAEETWPVPCGAGDIRGQADSPP